MTGKLIPLRRVEGNVEEMSDEALVAACKTGESLALAALFKRHQATVRRFFGRFAGTDERDLDDLVQSTFETIHKTVARFENRSSVKTWILGVATNVARHHVRSEVRRKRLASVFASTPRPLATDPTAGAGEHELAARLRAAVLGLSPKLREAFVLVYMEGLSGRQAAEAIGIGERAIWKRLHKANVQLRSELGSLIS